MKFLQTKPDIKHEKDQTPNRTGIPSYMKQDFETRSGLSYDDVRVHYSSQKPAELGALAYTQGTHVYIGPGQERHLPHELVHVAQQKRGEVRPTGRLGYVFVNDDSELERQADRGIVVQRAQVPSGTSFPIVQRNVGMEYQTVGKEQNVLKKENGIFVANKSHGDILFTVPYEKDKKITVTADGSDLEYVTPAVDTPDEAYRAGFAASEVHRLLGTYDDTQLSINGLSVIKNKTEKYWYCKTPNGEYKLTNIEDSTSAHPQATIGIRMDKIADLLSDLGGNPGTILDASGTVMLGLTTNKLLNKNEDYKFILRKQKQTMLEASNLAKKAVNNYLKKNHAKRAKVKDRGGIVSLLSLLIAYNRQFILIAQRDNAALNAKNAMPVMSRTSLYDAFSKLKTDNDREIFIEILNSVDFKEVNGSRISSRYWEKILAGQKGKKKKSKWKLVTVDAWKQAIAEGKDALHGKFHSISSIEDNDDEILQKFGISCSTDIGIKNSPGILVELRGLERNVEYDRWGETAYRVANLADCLNNGNIPDKEKVTTALKGKKDEHPLLQQQMQQLMQQQHLEQMLQQLEQWQQQPEQIQQHLEQMLQQLEQWQKMLQQRQETLQQWQETLQQWQEMLQNIKNRLEQLPKEMLQWQNQMQHLNQQKNLNQQQQLVLIRQQLVLIRQQQLEQQQLRQELELIWQQQYLLAQQLELEQQHVAQQLVLIRQQQHLLAQKLELGQQQHLLAQKLELGQQQHLLAQKLELGQQQLVQMQQLKLPSLKQKLVQQHLEMEQNLEDGKQKLAQAQQQLEAMEQKLELRKEQLQQSIKRKTPTIFVPKQNTRDKTIPTQNTLKPRNLTILTQNTRNLTISTQNTRNLTISTQNTRNLTIPTQNTRNRLTGTGNRH